MHTQKQPPYLTRYGDTLKALPASGGGGCHTALLGVANLGIRAGLKPDRICLDLRDHIHGSRHVGDREIEQAVDKAFQSKGAKLPKRVPKPSINGMATFANIAAKGRSFSEDDLQHASPVALPSSPGDHAELTLRTLYRPEEFLFVGDRHDAGPDHVRPVSSWHTDGNLLLYPHIIPNTLTGLLGPTKDGRGMTYRGDNAVAAFTLAVVEFDKRPLAEQVSFWCGVNLPVVALVDSGGKSIHGWLRVDAADAQAWDTQVRPLFLQHLAPLGVDRSCQNPARLSRLPGHYRQEKQRWQRLLFLDPAAKGPRHYLLGGRQ